jgi:hypothetical protein
MAGASGNLRWMATVGVATAIALFAPSRALGSDGEITQALASADWTRGDIVGMVSWSGCADESELLREPGPAPYCAWVPYATIGPGNSESECTAPDRDWPELGEDVTLAWWGGELVGRGRSKFDFSIVSLGGVPDQLLCLYAIERAQTGSATPCPPAAELAPPGWFCPGAVTSSSTALDSALLTVSPQAPEEEALPSEESPPPAEGEPPEGPQEQPVPPDEDEPPSAPAAPPAPPSSEITRAFASAGWTRGSIAGAITWNGCANAIMPPASSHFPSGEFMSLPLLYCAWVPYATIGPGSSESECAAPDRDWPALGEDVALAWWSGKGSAPGLATFDLPAVSLDGVPGQLLCLSAIEIAQVAETLPCTAPEPSLPPGWRCSEETNAYAYDLGSALLAAPTAAESGGQPSRPKGPAPLVSPRRD